MAGEKDLSKLLSSLQPKLLSGEYVFCTVKDARYGDFAELGPLASFVEQEGLTLVLLKEPAAELKLKHEGVFRCITLDVHSSLEAVGMLAAVSATLSNHGISANVIAAFHHDHVFVPTGTEARAMDALAELCEGKASWR